MAVQLAQETALRLAKEAARNAETVERRPIKNAGRLVYDVTAAGSELRIWLEDEHASIEDAFAYNTKEAPIGQLKCSICKDAFTFGHPRYILTHTKNDGKANKPWLCKSCTEKYNTRCPFNRQKVHGVAAIAEEDLLVSRARLFCLFEGCEVSGDRAEMLQHVSDCPERWVTCGLTWENRTCDEVMQMKNLASHRSRTSDDNQDCISFKCGACSTHVYGDEVPIHPKVCRDKWFEAHKAAIDTYQRMNREAQKLVQSRLSEQKAIKRPKPRSKGSCVRSRSPSEQQARKRQRDRPSVSMSREDDHMVQSGPSAEGEEAEDEDRWADYSRLFGSDDEDVAPRST